MQDKVWGYDSELCQIGQECDVLCIIKRITVSLVTHPPITTHLESDFSEFLDNVLLPLEVPEFLIQLYLAELHFSKRIEQTYGSNQVRTDVRHVLVQGRDKSGVVWQHVCPIFRHLRQKLQTHQNMEKQENIRQTTLTSLFLAALEFKNANSSAA